MDERYAWEKIKAEALAGGDYELISMHNDSGMTFYKYKRKNPHLYSTSIDLLVIE